MKWAPVIGYCIIPGWRKCLYTHRLPVQTVHKCTFVQVHCNCVDILPALKKLCMMLFLSDTLIHFLSQSGFHHITYLSEMVTSCLATPGGSPNKMLQYTLIIKITFYMQTGSSLLNQQYFPATIVPHPYTLSYTLSQVHYCYDSDIVTAWGAAAIDSDITQTGELPIIG